MFRNKIQAKRKNIPVKGTPLFAGQMEGSCRINCPKSIVVLRTGGQLDIPATTGDITHGAAIIADITI